MSTEGHATCWEEVKEYEDRIGQLERMLGQKEVEIALLKNFFSES